MKYQLLLISALLFFLTNVAKSQITTPTPYCDASFDDAGGFLVDDAINSVSFGTLMNTSNGQYVAPHYVYYNNLTPPNIIIGNTYAFSAIFNVAGGAGYGVWIDYNHNNTFETSEKVLGSTSTGFMNLGTTTISNNISIPASASSGNTRMRVRIVEDDMYTITFGASILPCNLSTSPSDVMDWGETEDYTINLTSVTGLDETTSLNQYQIYPNPATTSLSLSLNSPKEISYSILNILGEVLTKGELFSHSTPLDISALNEGVYFLNVMEGNNSLGIQRFVKNTK